MKPFFLVLILPLMVSFTDDKEEIINRLTSVRATYESMKSYRIDLEYSEYDAYSGGTLISVHKGVMNREGVNYSVVLPKQLTISTNNIIVVKNDDKKLVMIAHSDGKSRSPFSDLPIDKLLNMASSYKPLSNLKEGYVGYNFGFSSAAYDYVDIIINKSTNYLAKVIVYGKSLDENGKEVKGRLEIKYKNLTQNPDFPNGTFSTKNIITKKDDQYVLHPSLNGYQILDQTH